MVAVQSNNIPNTYLVTGVAGFIGCEVALTLLNQGHHVFGIDNLNEYYDVQLKHDRLGRIANHPHFQFHKVDIADASALDQLFKNIASAGQADNSQLIVIHLAAQAGVRYSIDHPQEYVQSNLVGFANILECCRHHKVKHLAYASSSSVYGANKKIPFSESDHVDNPVSLYAATKKSNELLAHSYAHLYQLPVTGLRFFTVYGPWGRPDMAYFLFTKAILANQAIDVFNHGEMRRDFTYIDDIVDGVIRVANQPPIEQEHDASNSKAPYKVYNIGNNQPEKLMDFIDILQEVLDHKAQLNFKPMVMGDVKETYANIDHLSQDFDFRPDTSLRDGLSHFAKWYLSYYKHK